MLDPVRARTFVGRIVFASLCDKLVETANEHFVQRLPRRQDVADWVEQAKTLERVRNY